MDLGYQKVHLIDGTPVRVLVVVGTFFILGCMGILPHWGWVCFFG